MKGQRRERHSKEIRKPCLRTTLEKRRSLVLAPRPQEQRTGGRGRGTAKEIQTCLQVPSPSAYICLRKDRFHDLEESLALEYTMVR